MENDNDEEFFRVSLKEQELPMVFPEAKEVIEHKIIGLKEEANNLRVVIKKKLSIIKEKSAPQNQWFWKAIVAVLDGEELNKILKNIKRLERILRLYNPSKEQHTSFMVDIERLKSIPIQDILPGNYKGSGGKLFGLCPLHNEKSPSFVIYTKTNSFYCFGCHKGGNVINLIRLLYGYSFIEAVKYIQKYGRY